MISIVKPNAPAVLQRQGKAQTRALAEAYEAAPAAYQTGAKTFAFKGSIYAETQVKQTLKAAQHDKCFLCESKISHIAYGDVEHFRPKAGYRQNESDDLARPGYYWLAYAWSNLFLACQICNQEFKKNLFPLRDPDKRAVSHNDDITREEPLFINPETEPPERFISFRQATPFAIGGNERGHITIIRLGLDREKLQQRRESRYEMLRVLFFVARDEKVSEDVRQQAQALLAKAVEPSAEYSAMARAAIDHNFSALPES